jgi:hypothetical protein
MSYTQKRRQVTYLMLSILISLVWCTHAQAWNEPTGYLGIPWGATMTEAQKRLPTHCSKSDSSVCSGSYRNLREMEQIWFGAQGMNMVIYLTPPDEFSHLKREYIARYGAPTEQTTRILPNIFGAQFRSERLFWFEEKVTILLDQFWMKDMTYSLSVTCTRGWFAVDSNCKP